MKKKIFKLNNAGFSFIELIVIIAIMAVAVGFASLSISLITGSEAKKAYKKLDAMLNEVKTGAMSRYDEDITVEYKLADAEKVGPSGASGDYDRDGFYGIKDIKTITTSGTGSGGANDSLRYVEYAAVSLGSESRLICDDRVKISFQYKDPDGNLQEPITLRESGHFAFTIRYNRANGLFKEVIIDNDEDNPQGVPVKIVLSSGLNNRRNYVIVFDENTGRHRLEFE